MKSTSLPMTSILHVLSFHFLHDIRFKTKENIDAAPINGLVADEMATHARRGKSITPPIMAIFKSVMLISFYLFSGCRCVFMTNIMDEVLHPSPQF